MKFEYLIEGGDFIKAGHASSDVKKILNQLNIDPVIVRRIAVAMYEGEVNVVAHAYRGIMKVNINPERIIVTIQDEGPGIADIDKAMQEGLFNCIGQGKGDGIWRRYGPFEYEKEFGSARDKQRD